MKYKVGDKVRVRSDLTEGKEYGGVFVISDMSELRGKIVTIARILYDDCTPLKSCYTIKEMECCWTDDMFEPVPYDGKERLIMKIKFENGSVLESIESYDCKRSKHAIIYYYK
ncbi:MAG: hypothetical protein KHZ96_07580 [Coprobacillus sp.]|nr:hypothetical protein [Coprobacillus sp.]